MGIELFPDVYHMSYGFFGFFVEGWHLSAFRSLISITLRLNEFPNQSLIFRFPSFRGTKMH
jgi:hypothetical protein